MKSFSRREFLKTSAVVGSAPLLAGGAASVSASEAQGTSGIDPGAASGTARWYKGQLHTHSQWSDGGGMPESVCAVYKENGYDFFCLSDHNGFQSEELKFKGFGFSKEPADKSAFEGETSTWKCVIDEKGWAKMRKANYQQAIDKFGEGSVKMKVVDGDTYVRLKTFAELEEQFNEPGEFLLIPGWEQTGSSQDGMQVHMNFINVKSWFPYIRKADPAETIYETMIAGEKEYADNDEPYLFILNHPQWPYYDISPEVLVKLDRVLFWELTNNPRSGGPTVDGAWDPEKYWDVVNAYRAANRKPLLWGTGSDDAHSIYPNAVCKDGPFFGWNMVRAEELTTRAIIESMLRGDFYVSTGVTLKDVQFCKETGTLKVSVDAVSGEGVKIEFIGTKKTFDRKSEIIETEKPKRKIGSYPDNIGVVLKTVDGLEGEYTLQQDDLYVRARITVAGSEYEKFKKYELLMPCAWTQPYTK